MAKPLNFCLPSRHILPPGNSSIMRYQILSLDLMQNVPRKPFLPKNPILFLIPSPRKLTIGMRYLCWPAGTNY